MALVFFLEAIERVYTDSETAKRFARNNLDSFREALTRTLSNFLEVTSSFIVSFTTDSSYEVENRKSGGDRLSQWRGYSLGKQGFCLAFDYLLDQGDRRPSSRDDEIKRDAEALLI